MDRSHFEVVADVDQRHWWFLGRRRILRNVVAALLPPNPNTTIVDVGCGTGANIAALADDYRCVGIDTSADAIEFARQRFPKVTFFTGIAPRDLGEEAARADAMLLMDVLEHVPNDRAVLEPLIRAAHPGALILITVPADMKLWSSHDVGLLHYRRYDPDMLQKAWAGLPVELVAMTHFCSRLYPLARLQRGLGTVREKLASAPAPGSKRNWDMKVPAGPMNRLLERTFAGESSVVVETVRKRRTHGYRRGVSLMAVLKKTTETSAGNGGGAGGAT